MSGEADAEMITGREFTFTPQDFERIRTMIYDRAGISLNFSKQEMVYSRLAKRLRANNLAAFSEYIALLDRGNTQEWEAFINALTTNLTYFFREAHHFALLAEHVKSAKHPVLLWCAASSTGEEAYSMAMTMAELYGSMNPPVRIIASDVDTTVLEKARAGVYNLSQIERLPHEKFRKYFTEAPGNQVRICTEIKNMITFTKINLLDERWPVKGPFDAIFCRNVMIYFDKKTQARILEKFAPLLRQDGLLFAGHSESFHHVANLFRLRGKTVYELASHG
ncbi:MAG: chemotaxis protein CheR [Burkholderiales bacterium]|nr:chemotaxis protein CheR [Burkholderiales bacterium]